MCYSNKWCYSALEPTHRLEVVEITTTAVQLQTVRQLREKCNLTQVELARKAGISPQTAYRLEDPDWPYGINEEAAEWVADVLGVPASAVAWLRAPSNTGRPAGAGKPRKKSLASKQVTCPTCRYTLPATGICDNCE